jgi:MarR family transcriptional regulator, organic hydroperoxide resistance regulator
MIMRLALGPASASRPAGETLRFMQKLWHLAHALQVRSRRMMQDLGVTGPQRLVVRVIGQSPGVGPRELATTLGLHPSTLTGVLSRLERDGLLDRCADPADRRRARLWLTRAGRKIDRERQGTVEAAVRRALARADRETIERTEHMIRLLVEELARDR